MTKEYDALVFVGRMQPFHNGHKAVIKKALSLSKHVIIVLGSCWQPRTVYNPFTFAERKEMIESSFSDKNLSQIKIVGVIDYPYDDNAWVTAVQTAVRNALLNVGWSDYPPKIGIIGHSKDASSYYINIFPKSWGKVEVENVDDINATDIRNSYFDIGSVSNTTEGVVTFLDKFKETYDYSYIVASSVEEEDYKEKSSMKGFNYSSTFVTTDAVVTQNAHLLLIKRKKFPYEGCWALPGGFLAPDYRLVDNMIKELREETLIKIPEKVLRGSIKDTQIFDAPKRDPRGRFITHAFYIDLGFPREKLPKVKGADDAAEARWFHLSEVTSDMMAFDHYHIIKTFISTYNN